MLKGRHILVVDDCAVARETLRSVLVDAGADVALANDPYEAVRALRVRVPDVLVLDLELPRMDGLTFLTKLMAQHPLPVVVCSATARPGSKGVFKALESGALEAVAKPEDGKAETLEAWRHALLGAVVRAVTVPKERLGSGPNAIVSVEGETGFTRAPFGAPETTAEAVVMIGASTGGTRALADFLPRLPRTMPGIVVVQHMPPAFTGPFAQHLDTLCVIDVREAVDGDRVEAGLALIAPGGKQTSLRRDHRGYFVDVKVAPPVNRHCPSVDVLFESASGAAGGQAVGVILTGMGDDGARGMKTMHAAGAATYAQDEATCVVFGMPKEAIRLGGVDKVAPLAALPRLALLAALGKQRKRIL